MFLAPESRRDFTDWHVVCGCKRVTEGECAEAQRFLFCYTQEMITMIKWETKSIFFNYFIYLDTVIKNKFILNILNRAELYNYLYLQCMIHVQVDL